MRFQVQLKYRLHHSTDQSIDRSINPSVSQAVLQDGKVPNDWKQANVTAIFKKGDKTSPCNNRPVSLTSHVCKLLESLIRDSILEHVKKFNFIRNTQHGFRKKRSCLTNLLKFLELVTDYVDKGMDPIVVIYLDF